MLGVCHGQFYFSFVGLFFVFQVSRGHRELCQLGGFFEVGAIVASLSVPEVGVYGV